MVAKKMSTVKFTLTLTFYFKLASGFTTNFLLKNFLLIKTSDKAIVPSI